MEELTKSIIAEIKLLSQKITPEYLSLKDASLYCTLNRKFIRRAIEKGELAAADMAKGVGRRIWRIRRKDLDAWIEAYKVVAAPLKNSRQAVASKYFSRPS